jgi:hypothetical protein
MTKKGLQGIKGIPIIKLKSKVYIHESLQIGWFRFAYYRLGSKFSVRFEIARGWDN